MHERGFLIDRNNQAWVRATGRTVRFGEHRWLDGPSGSPTFAPVTNGLPREARRLDADLHDGGGLLESFDLLAGEAFDPSRLTPAIVDFYGGNERVAPRRGRSGARQRCPAAGCCPSCSRATAAAGIALTPARRRTRYGQSGAFPFGDLTAPNSRGLVPDSAIDRTGHAQRMVRPSTASRHERTQASGSCSRSRTAA